jgi:hypothetical protein
VPNPLAAARRVKVDLQARIGADPRVRGVGIAPSAGGFAVRVLVADPAAAADLGLPSQVDGVPVDVVAVGEIRAQD